MSKQMDKNLISAGPSILDNKPDSQLSLFEYKRLTEKQKSLGDQQLEKMRHTMMSSFLNTNSAQGSTMSFNN